MLIRVGLSWQTVNADRLNRYRSFWIRWKPVWKMTCIVEFRRRSCLQKAFFEKPTTPSFRAYFITPIDALVSWIYQLINGIINDNWNGGKIHAFFLSLSQKGRLGPSIHTMIIIFIYFYRKWAGVLIRNFFCKSDPDLPLTDLFYFQLIFPWNLDKVTHSSMPDWRALRSFSLQISNPFLAWESVFNFWHFSSEWTRKINNFVFFHFSPVYLFPSTYLLVFLNHLSSRQHVVRSLL